MRILIAAFLTLAAASAQAGGAYVSLGGLHVRPNTQAVEINALDHTISTRLRMAHGFGAAAAVGYEIDGGWRGEVEIGYRSARLKDMRGFDIRGPLVTGSAAFKARFDSRIRLWTIMANGLYAADLGRIRPYVGFGIGAAFSTVERGYVGRGVQIGDRSTNYKPQKDETDTPIAWQAMAGVGYPLSGSVEVRLGYRYFAIGQGKYNKMKFAFTSHDIELGIRVGF